MHDSGGKKVRSSFCRQDKFVLNIHKIILLFMEAKKKLFYWDFARVIILFFIFYPIFGGAEINQKNLIGWAFKIGASEFLTNDGHIWGDIPWLLFNIDLRGQIWMFSQPIIVLFGFLWAYKNSIFAKKLRIANWTIALGLYAGWTIFFPTFPKYDYFIFAYVLFQSGWLFMLFIAVIISLAMMWAGIIIIPGYLIYKSLKEENDNRAKNILFFLSMGVPGAGHVAIGKYKRGLIFLAAGSVIWAIDFYLFFITPLAFIPTLLFWLYAARDVYREAGISEGLNFLPVSNKALQLR